MKDKHTIHNSKNKLKLLLFVVVIILLIVFGVLHNNKVKNDKNTVNDENDRVIEEFKEPITYSGEIDLTNKENVSIEGNTKTNISENLLKDREFEGLHIVNVSLIAERDISKFKATIVNNTGKNYNEKNVVFVFKDKNGKTTVKIDTLIPTTPNGGNNDIELWCLNDLVNSYDYTIETTK